MEVCGRASSVCTVPRILLHMILIAFDFPCLDKYFWCIFVWALKVSIAITCGLLSGSFSSPVPNMKRIQGAASDLWNFDYLCKKQNTRIKYSASRS